MWYSLALLLFISPTVAATTDLQTNCTGPDRVYNGTSCYVVVKPGIRHSAAKLLCNHYLGYAGHLYRITNAAVQAATRQLISTYPYSTAWIWTGLEPKNSSAALNDNNNWGYYFRNGTFVSPTYRPWQSGQPAANTANNRVYYDPQYDTISNRAENVAYFYICEYEEALKLPVTDLEKKCVNLTSSSVLTSFVNDVCYVLQPAVTKFYSDAKVACNALNGYDGHLAHVRTMEELWIAEALRSAANVLIVRLGIAQTNTSSTDPYTGWYLTTPTNPPELTTFLPWATSYPTASMRTIGVTSGYPKSFASLSLNTAYPFICQYESLTPITTTTTTTTTTAGEASSTKITTLKSECMGKAGSHFAYSSCYFLANISGAQATASDYCMNQGGQLASLFGEDLVSQLGSLFLQFSSVQAWIGLKVTGGKLKWMVDNVPHALFKNISTPPTGSECYALVSDRSSLNAIENPRLSPMACSASLQQVICMKSDHIYSSYSIQGGKKVIEAESPESVTTEIDSGGCGARCSEIIGCVGFNFNPSDGSCIPTKVSPAMPSVIDGVTTYTVEIESSWNFYERI
uniref:C-type lectin domain-containing protein n=1 Tax=Plectus sambesii TaxID=2011161 RepID=A0A914WDU3_9BILA